MCSPELWKGLCCICIGTLTPETTLVDDLHQGRGGVHKGVCAIMAGIVPEEHREESDRLVDRIQSAVHGPARRKFITEYYAWVYSVAAEDHYERSSL